MDKEDLVLLKFTEKETTTKLRWKESNEFEYSSQMYDLVEIEMHGDTTYYWCWRDEKETKLNQKLDHLLAFALGHDSKNNENQKRLNNFFKSLFNPKIEIRILTFDEFVLDNLHYQFLVHNYSFSPPFPPPELS